MKYFLKWLVNDIKSDWAENWPERKTTLMHMWSGAKFLIQMASWLILFITIVAVIVIKATGDDVSWVACGKVIFGVALLNATIFISGKLGEYNKDKERLMQTLKD